MASVDKNLIQELFDGLVPSIGGRVLDPQDTKDGGDQADWLFERQGWVVEHKALLDDQTNTFFSKVLPVVKAWKDKNGGKFPPGVTLDEERKMVIDINACERKHRRLFNRFLKNMVRRLLKKANGQIRDSIRRYGLEGKVRGALFVCNDGNKLHGQYPHDYMRVVMEVMKPKNSDEWTYPYLNGLIYCSSLNMKSHSENLGFWFFEPNEDRQLAQLQLGLKIAYGDHLQKTLGKFLRVNIWDGGLLTEEEREIASRITNIGFVTLVHIDLNGKQSERIVPTCAVDKDGNPITNPGTPHCGKQLRTGTLPEGFVFDCEVHGRIGVLASEGEWLKVMLPVASKMIVRAGHRPIEPNEPVGVWTTQKPIINPDGFLDVLG
jgi:hypothetical protein